MKITGGLLSFQYFWSQSNFNPVLQAGHICDNVTTKVSRKVNRWNGFGTTGTMVEEKVVVSNSA